MKNKLPPPRVDEIFGRHSRANPDAHDQSYWCEKCQAFVADDRVHVNTDGRAGFYHVAVRPGQPGVAHAVVLADEETECPF